MTYFSTQERIAFTSLRFNPYETPYFDPMRYCLRWRDEEPANLDSQGYEKLIDLVIARSFLHLNKPESEWYVVEKTTYFRDCWQAAKREIFNWPGFKRQSLNDIDQQYLNSELAKSLDEHF